MKTTQFLAYQLAVLLTGQLLAAETKSGDPMTRTGKQNREGIHLRWEATARHGIQKSEFRRQKLIAGSCIGHGAAVWFGHEHERVGH